MQKIEDSNITLSLSDRLISNIPKLICKVEPKFGLKTSNSFKFPFYQMLDLYSDFSQYIPNNYMCDVLLFSEESEHDLISNHVALYCRIPDQFI